MVDHRFPHQSKETKGSHQFLGQTSMLHAPKNAAAPCCTNESCSMGVTGHWFSDAICRVWWPGSRTHWANCGDIKIKSLSKTVRIWILGPVRRITRAGAPVRHVDWWPKG